MQTYPELYSKLFPLHPFPLHFRQNNTIVDTVLSAPRSSYHNVTNLIHKQVQSGNFSDLKVVPGYYTVATDRGEVTKGTVSGR